MRVSVEMDDATARRVCPCEKNGEHDHSKCVMDFLEQALHGTTFKREAEKFQSEFQKSYQRPSLTVTTE